MIELRILLGYAVRRLRRAMAGFSVRARMEIAAGSIIIVLLILQALEKLYASPGLLQRFESSGSLTWAGLVVLGIIGLTDGIPAAYRRIYLAADYSLLAPLPIKSSTLLLYRWLLHAGRNLPLLGAMALLVLKGISYADLPLVFVAAMLPIWLVVQQLSFTVGCLAGRHVRWGRTGMPAVAWMLAAMLVSVWIMRQGILAGDSVAAYGLWGLLLSIQLTLLGPILTLAPGTMISRTESSPEGEPTGRENRRRRVVPFRGTMRSLVLRDVLLMVRRPSIGMLLFIGFVYSVVGGVLGAQREAGSVIVPAVGGMAIIFGWAAFLFEHRQRYAAAFWLARTLPLAERQVVTADWLLISLVGFGCSLPLIAAAALTIDVGSAAMLAAVLASAAAILPFFACMLMYLAWPMIQAGAYVYFIVIATGVALVFAFPISLVLALPAAFWLWRRVLHRVRGAGA